MIRVRRARADDIEAMSSVLTASIRELCIADHHNDPAKIAAWLRNKTPDEVAKMLAGDGIEMFVAERAGVVAAVGLVNAQDEIGLNYVSPAHRFAGVSKALLLAMEERLRQRGATMATLTSTATAHRFYRAAGWEDVAVSGADPAYPMRKRL